jgi:hypothetical protein
MFSVYVHFSGKDVDPIILKANEVKEKMKKTANVHTESSTFDLSSIIEAKVGKLVEFKITELLRNSLKLNLF